MKYSIVLGIERGRDIYEYSIIVKKLIILGFKLLVVNSYK